MATMVRHCSYLLCTFTSLVFAAAAPGETLLQKPPGDACSAEVVQARLKQVEESHELDEPAKVKLRELYQQALHECELLKSWADKVARFEQMTAAAADDLVKTKDALASLPPKPVVAIPQDVTLPQIDQAISKKEAELDEGRAALAELEAEPKRRATRRVEIPKLSAAARERLAEVSGELQAMPADDASPPAAARRMLLAARRSAIEQEIAAYEKEIAAYEATTELLPLRRDLAARRVSLAEHEVKHWHETANQRRQQEAEQQVQHASREASLAHPAVRGLAQENAALAARRKELAQCIVETTHQLEAANQQLSAVKDRFARVCEKVKAAGLTNAVGLLLRKQRESLPSLASHRRSINAWQSAIGQCQLAELELRDRRSELANLEMAVRAALRRLNPHEVAADGGELEAAVRESLQTEKDYLDALIADHNTYFGKLVDLDTVERQLIGETEKCARYIDERILWIASETVPTAADIRHAGDALWWLAGPAACADIGRTLLADAARDPAIAVLAACVLATLIYWRGRLRARIREIGERAARATCWQFVPTLEALLLTCLIAIVWPGLLGYLGWRLSAAADASELCKAVGAGLAATARVYLALELLRHACQLNGLGESHFGWPASGLKLLRHHVKWLTVAVLPLVLVAMTLDAQENERWDGSLGRFGFVAALVFFSLFLQRVLRPAGGVLQAVLATRHGGWLDRFRYAWYPLAVAMPPCLAVLATAGYYYTGKQFAERLIITMYLLWGVILLRALALRWILANQRKLAFEQVRQRRAAAQAEAGATEEASGPTGLPAVAPPQRDLATINAQSRRFVGYTLALAGCLALWFVWVDVAPALRILDRVQVWPTVGMIETVAAADGTTTLHGAEQTGAITLAHVGLAVLILATSLLAAKNIPGLLEMAVLQHLPVDAGVRYAIVTISRYSITFLGLVLAFSAVGLGWSQIQWLVALVGVGLGFGLQEIFANFVSGLIILFERPVRVGDVITIDNVTGIVSRIRMRATTITDWDRKELIIPNKEFITGRVLNWTLSDQVNRVVIKVGIAYGSDTERAAELLWKVATGHPTVLTDPPPKVTLEEFGDSALSFVLRCFLPNLENRLTVIHELHMRIDRLFREAGIEIAYPQHDVHVRSIDVGADVLQSLQGAASVPQSTRVMPRDAA